MLVTIVGLGTFRMFGPDPDGGITLADPETNVEQFAWIPFPNVPNGGAWCDMRATLTPTGEPTTMRLPFD